ncbi:OmpA family protein [Porphyromonas sp.]|uniref:OmpA family protein n=1 Tax=Porphyromonas sp. TaxID=1924944 RepID=UPI0026DCB919|nr:OmpA family protein [Porphyromonas sp.]MDO4770466.1 OmpA family protein [Porphyromonas sp.]
MKKLAIILITITLSSLGLFAQEVERNDDDRYLPITREQAEMLITKMIIEARAPHIKARATDRMVQSFKIETLKRRLLDQALRDSYIDEYKVRMDRMEKMLMTLILAQSNGKVDPTVIQNIITQGSTGTTPVLRISDSVPARVSDPGISQNIQELISALESATDELQKSNVVPEDNVSAVKEVDAATSFVVIDSKVFFNVGSHTLSNMAKSDLDNVAFTMTQHPSMKLQLKGYASPEGNVTANNRLSQRRVESVAKYLQSKGVNADRLVLVPAGIDSMKDQLKEARRVELRTVR